MKKKFLIVSVIALLCVSVLATWAYLNAEETTTNVISTGAVEMDLYELDGDGIVHYQGMAFDDVMPGMTLHKEPRIKNVDATQPFYTRAKAVVTVTAADRSILSDEYVKFNIGSDWAYDGEWYYYKGIVKPGVYVTFFDTVSIDPAMGNEYQNCRITIEVKAQAVQVKNNELQGDDYTKIIGWPEE